MTVLIAYVHLPVPRRGAEFCEVLRFTECVDTLINSWKMMRILEIHRVKLPVIDT